MVSDVPFSDACPNFETQYDECGATATAAQQVKVNLLFVVDKSGSMDNVPDGYSQNLWLSMNTALEGVLTGVQDLMNVGLELYPYPESASHPIALDCEDNCCEMPEQNDMNVQIGPGGRTVEPILEALSETSPGGGTPTAEALRQALKYLQGAHLDGKTYVVLATDGGPNCNASTSCDADACTMHIDGECKGVTDRNCCEEVPLGCLDSDQTTDAIQNLRDSGFRTYVVGIPGSEPYEPALNEFALAGGVPNEDPDDPEAPSYYRVSASGGVGELESTFRRITEQLVTSCTLPLSKVPPSRQLVNVAVDCTIIPQTDDDGTVNWELSNDGLSVELLGNECERITDAGVRRLDVLLGCPTTTLG